MIMRAHVDKKLTLFCAGLSVAAIAVAVTGTLRAQDLPDSNLTYTRGQPVIPAYEGWYPNPDGTIDLWFGYLNHNYKEEPDIPIGPENNISPAAFGPDGGQPTHFLPRNNRWVFTVRVPKDFGNKEVVWTVTTHGKTYKAYATLKPGYLHDDIGMQREYFGEPTGGKNQRPVIKIDGDVKRTAKVGEPVAIAYTASDDGEKQVVPRTLGAGGGFKTPSICGDDRSLQHCGEPIQGSGGMFSVKGLRTMCFPYRGAGEAIKFDPQQPKAWEDHRTGESPWAAGYTLPPIPPDHKWTVHTTFSQPGTYVVRCQAHDGFFSTNQNVTINVTK